MEQIPDKLWLLRITDNGNWCRAVDDGGDDLLCYTSLANAKAGAEHQADLYDIVCKPVRVK